MKDLRLGYLVPEFPGQTHAFFWQEVRALRRAGEEVLLMSTRKPSPLICRHDFVPVAVAETHYLYPPNASNLAYWIAAGLPGLSRARAYLGALRRSEFKSRLRQYGLLAVAVELLRWARVAKITHIHGHSCADAAHVLALARCLGGPPYSLTLHGDLEVYGTDHESKMNGAAFVCVAGSHLRKQVLERTGVPSDRVLVTWMGVDTSKFTPLGSDRSYIRGSLHLVTVARLHPSKGHLHAIASIHRGIQAGLNLHYTIAGEGAHMDFLQSMVNDLNLGAHVTMAGTLSEKEVTQLLSRADAFILPSIGLGEAWPVSVMEAMAAGLPVIASIVGATPEIITSGEDGILVPQRDERALFESIMLLANDTDTRRRIADAARRTAERRFDVKATAGLLRDAIHASIRPWIP